MSRRCSRSVVAAAIIVIAACGGASPLPATDSTTAPPTLAAPAESVQATHSTTLPSVTPATDGTQVNSTTSASNTSATISPLAAELISKTLDLGSAVYDPASVPARRPRPSSISIPRLAVVDAPVDPIGVTASGELDVPGPQIVGWYEFGATLDEPGSSVLAGHVDFDGVPGVFRYLTKLNPNDVITVTANDGSRREYVVTERVMYDKDKLPPERVWNRMGESTLVLITCGGQFNRSLRSFEQNIVVYARLAN